MRIRPHDLEVAMNPRLRRLLVLLAAGSLSLAGGSAVASPPDGDPTCGNPGGPASGQECAGDNGQPGCDGIAVAEGTPAGEYAGDALDLVNDILGEGLDSNCD
jgi:hypothetical protein